MEKSPDPACCKLTSTSSAALPGARKDAQSGHYGPHCTHTGFRIKPVANATIGWENQPIMHLKHPCESERASEHDSVGTGESTTGVDTPDVAVSRHWHLQSSWQPVSSRRRAGAGDDEDEIGDVPRHFADT